MAIVEGKNISLSYGGKSVSINSLKPYRFDSDKDLEQREKALGTVKTFIDNHIVDSIRVMLNAKLVGDDIVITAIGKARAVSTHYREIPIEDIDRFYYFSRLIGRLISREKLYLIN